MHLHLGQQKFGSVQSVTNGAGALEFADLFVSIEAVGFQRSKRENEWDCPGTSRRALILSQRTPKYGQPVRSKPISMD